MIINYFEKKVVKDYRKNLKKLRLKAEKYFFVLVNKRLMIQLNKKYRLIVAHLDDINPKKKNTYFEKKENQIQELLGQESILREQIHEVRKQLKILNYNRTIANKEKQDQDLVKQDVLPKLLGKWHDHQVIIKHLKKALEQGQISPTEASQLQIIQSKIANESNILFNEIKKTIAVAGVFGGYN